MRGFCAQCGATNTVGYEIDRRGSVVCKDCNGAYGGFQPGWTPLVWIDPPERALEPAEGVS